MLMRLMGRNGSAWVLMACCVAAVIGVAQLKSQADEEKDSGESVWKLKPFEIPETNEPDELFKFVQETLGEEPEFKSDEEQRAHQLRSMITLIAVGDRILKLPEATDDTLEKGAQLKLQGHVNLAMLGADQGADKAIGVVRAMQKDPRPILVEFGKNNEQLVRIICISGLGPEARDELVDEVLAELEKRNFAQRVFKRAMMLSEMLDESGDTDRLITFYTKLAKLMRASDNENLAAQAIRIEGQVRQLQLPGQFMELEASTLAGEKFDWSAYRGKVVLIDFWATWCGPCRAELPNVKKNYKKYHAKGFEVVGISLDEDQAELEDFLKTEKIPWVTLFEPEEKDRGWEHPLAVRYGVTGIPKAILVDREGKVLSMSARGSTLEELLEEQFSDK